ncbi:hypothetical protein O181_046810 [Austropuccinia psidii MF-1]|uniref:Uncharacterized protein n=1 Tax=Austropuccinia psidii MF-1 TaxID=1389203 RepID=A0A9Q3DU58_9BASI|nr:hypothetical protein [Austropuccinia psidii MF-1]
MVKTPGLVEKNKLFPNIERDQHMSWFLKQKDRLTSLHPDMSGAMIHKMILTKCGGDLENSMRSIPIEPCSTKDYINSMEDITTRTVSL